jgi:superfamily I DNA/RNA helicase
VDGPILVLAGAGSGKTRVITSRIARLIATDAAAPENLLAVTFTNKAANEMRERVAGLVGKKRSEHILISTFHSFCLQVLRTDIHHLGYRKNFSIATEGDTRTIVRRVLGDLNGSHVDLNPTIVKDSIGTVKNAMVEPEEVVPSLADESAKEKYITWMPEVYERYQSALRAANALDFDDLLYLTLKLWREHPRVLAKYQKRFRYVMVDEFQDTNGVQFDLLKLLVEPHRNICVVGDDDQSIYAWRGADSRNILQFDRHFPGSKIIALEQNYRSTQTILDAANTVIARNTARREKKLWSALGQGRSIDWLVTGDEDHEAKMAVSWMLLIREKARAPYKDFAILYRSNNQARPIEIALRGASIPYVVIGGQEFFERSEVKDIISYLKVIENPFDEVSLLRIINMPRRGIGDTTLHKVHELCQREGIGLLKGLRRACKEELASRDATRGIEDFLSLVREYQARMKKGEPLPALVTDLIKRIEYEDELKRSCKSQEQWMQRKENVDAVVQAVKDYAKEARRPTMAEFLDKTALNTDADRKSKDERRKSAVTLMTVHSSKGLEFPFVFVMGVEEGLMPHDRSIKEDNLEEERRLFYVALTRAQRHVTLFEAVSRTKFGREVMTETSRFVKEIPDELVKQSVHAARDMVEARVAPPKPKPKRRRSARR